MEGQYIYEGTVAENKSTGKVYLIIGNLVTDLNTCLKKFVGEKVKVVIAKAEDI